MKNIIIISINYGIFNIILLYMTDIIQKFSLHLHKIDTPDGTPTWLPFKELDDNIYKCRILLCKPI